MCTRSNEAYKMQMRLHDSVKVMIEFNNTKKPNEWLNNELLTLSCCMLCDNQ
jgi:hypothetical protein